MCGEAMWALLLALLIVRKEVLQMRTFVPYINISDKERSNEFVEDSDIEMDISSSQSNNSEVDTVSLPSSADEWPYEDWEEIYVDSAMKFQRRLYERFALGH